MVDRAPGAIRVPPAVVGLVVVDPVAVAQVVVALGGDRLPGRLAAEIVARAPISRK